MTPSFDCTPVLSTFSVIFPPHSASLKVTSFAKDPAVRGIVPRSVSVPFKVRTSFTVPSGHRVLAPLNVYLPVTGVPEVLPFARFSDSAPPVGADRMMSQPSMLMVTPMVTGVLSLPALSATFTVRVWSPGGRTIATVTAPSTVIFPITGSVSPLEVTVTGWSTSASVHCTFTSTF